MSRRTVAGLLALGLVAVLVTLAARKPVDYVTFRPGPTMNILGEYAGKKIIDVEGHKTYPADGTLRMVTVYESGPDQKISLFDVFSGWIDPDVAVLPKSAVYQPDDTDDTAKEESALQMSSSQDDAKAAALGALGVEYRTEVEVTTVAEDGASAGKLEAGDVLLAVDGKSAPDPMRLVDLIRAVEPGTETTVTIRRDGSKRDVTVTTQPAPDDPKASRIGVGIQPRYVFPFDVKIQLPGSVGGPSAGMIFALTIYDVLTPGALTGGRQVAGSGTIGPDGSVGPIGGIAQKLPAAQRDGAKLFLVAEDNCAEAVRAHYDPDKMRLVKVRTLAEAIKDIETWRENPDAALPRCAR